MLRSITFDITADEPDLAPRRWVHTDYLFVVITDVDHKRGVASTNISSRVCYVF